MIVEECVATASLGAEGGGPHVTRRVAGSNPDSKSKSRTLPLPAVIREPYNGTSN